MKKIAVMQPYVFPYIGYFQLISAVDTFIFYDDVNFIKQGWINRNNILVKNDKKLITLPCTGASSYQKINKVLVSSDDAKFEKILKTIVQSYSKAPYFSDVIELILEVLNGEHQTISKLSSDSVIKICSFLKMEKVFKYSSEEHAESINMSRENRLIDICKKEDSLHYINTMGGQNIYDKGYFKERGIKLNFLDPNITEYKQFGNNFVPNLSIIDVLMFNSKECVVDMLHGFSLK